MFPLLLFKLFDRIRFPTAAASVCFAFDPMHDQAGLRPSSSLLSIPSLLFYQLDIERGHLVMIPNGDRKHLLFYLSTLIIDFTQQLLKQLERMVSNHFYMPILR